MTSSRPFLTSGRRTRTPCYSVVPPRPRTYLTRRTDAAPVDSTHHPPSPTYTRPSPTGQTEERRLLRGAECPDRGR